MVFKKKLRRNLRSKDRLDLSPVKDQKPFMECFMLLQRNKQESEKTKKLRTKLNRW